MPSVQSARPASYVPRRFASGTFPVSRNYNLRQMLYNYSYSGGRVSSEEDSSDQVIPSFPFGDIPVYADTVDIETLAFHNFWGCLLTPDNVAARIGTDDLRYHVWVAAKRVVESGLVKLSDKEALVRAVMNQFMVELGLVLLDLCPGPLVLFVDPRLHDNPDQMVSTARTLVARFDEAHVRRWRILLPATDEGIIAAQELVHRHGIQTNLSLVSCLEQAAACIDAGAGMVSMSVRPIMEWFDKQQRGCNAEPPSRDYPGIEAVQSCATFIRYHGLNTTLLATDVRKWAELKQLSGIGATALTKPQLDQIPMQHMVTWYLRSGDTSPATLRAIDAARPTHDLDATSSPGLGSRGMFAKLPAERRSLVSAVLFVRLRKMAASMDAIEEVVLYELKRRIRLETVPYERLYRRWPSRADTNETLRRARSSTTRSTSRSSGSRRRSESRRDERQARATDAVMVEGVDYF